MKMTDESNQIFDRQLVRARRRRYGPDAPSFLSDFAVQELTGRLAEVNRSFEKICALNAVPGLAHALKSAGHTGSIVTMDSAHGLLRPEDELSFVGDEEFLPLKPQSLPCILSILSLQLVNDLPGCLIQIRRSLREDGLFLGALMGAGSFGELRQVFIQAEAELSAGVAPRVAPLPDVRDLGSLLQRAGFALPVVDSDKITVRYSDFTSLMKDIRSLGWANPLTQRTRNFLRRDVLLRAGELYHDQFADPDGRIRSTFEVVWLTGWSPHESQQKPLPPGSAKHRLADALGTSEHRWGRKRT